MAVAIVLGALAGAAGFAPLFAGLRMTRRVTDTSNLVVALSVAAIGFGVSNLVRK